MKTEPLVSICCITYNHEDFIKDSIEGFLMQRTTFPIEIIIHDDASTDRTVEIILEYARQHSNLFLTILQKENQYSQGIRPFPNFVFPRVRGKYIALCEGDDYWIDPLKLQKQVEHLENNPQLSMVFTNRNRLNLKNQLVQQKTTDNPKYLFNKEDVLLDFIATTQTMMIRNYGEEMTTFMTQHPLIYGGDRQITYFASLKGTIEFMPFVSSVYRVTETGVHSKQTTFEKLQIGISSFIDLHYALGLGINELMISNLVNTLRRYTPEERKLVRKNLPAFIKTLTKRFPLHKLIWATIKVYFRKKVIR